MRRQVGGASKIRQVEVAWATSRPAASIIRASARAVRRPRCSTEPRHVIRPEVTVTARRNLTLKSSDVYPTPAGRVLCTEQAAAVSSSGNRYLSEPEGPPLDFGHRDCGEPVHVEARCAAGHHVADNRDVLPQPGPGARRR
jgi:hypothetical protein